MNDPVLQRYGGAKGVSRLAFRLYDLVQASDRLRPYFDGVDMPRLLDHAAAFIVGVLGSRPIYTDAQLADMHSHLEIGDAEFDEMLALLARAIADEGVSEPDAERALRHFRRLRDRLVHSLDRGSPVPS